MTIYKKKNDTNNNTNSNNNDNNHNNHKNNNYIYRDRERVKKSFLMPFVEF